MEPDDANDETIMLTRRMRRDRPADAAAAAPTAEEADDEIDESTFIVEDRTVVVDRGRKAAGAARDTIAEVSYDTVRVQAPPSTAVEDNPQIYKPRPAPLVPASPPALAGDIAPTRVTDAVIGSVFKASRRRSLYAVAAVSAACVVSVAGLALLAFAVFGG